MKKRFWNRRLPALAMAAVVAVGSLAGCGQEKPAESAGQTEEVLSSEEGTASPEEGAAASEEGMAASEEGTPAPGEVIAGFTLTEKGSYPDIGAEVLTFHHDHSGADLVYFKNDDPNLGFAIGYRTPVLDESGTNHVFEHAITAASEKYPSKDIFFDMYGKTSCTFLNAFTQSCTTVYPISSQSEAQLKKMADVYLDCMVEPLLLRDRNYFEREAVHYQLYDKDDPISMTGVVFNEDYGRMTDMSFHIWSETLRAMNPGLPACEVSRSDIHYEDLTYEGIQEAFDRFYHFDNALIMLYGDMDYRDFMEYLDQEYLSKAEAGHTATEYFKEYPAPEGYTEKVVDCPAYEGDNTEQVTYVNYAVSIQDKSYTDFARYSLIAAMLNMEESPLKKKLQESGLAGTADCGVDCEFGQPMFVFMLENTDPDAAQSWKQIVDETVEEIAENGLDDSLAEAALAFDELNGLLMRENDPTELFAIELVPQAMEKWAQTGKADVYRDELDAYEEVRQDPQKWIRDLAGVFRDGKSRVLVTVVPAPGLAEQMDEERDRYLEEKKAAMTDEEISQLIEDTRAFDEWNEKELSNNDFMISAEELPAPREVPEFTKKEISGFTNCASAVDIEDISMNRLQFDTSAVAYEDLPYLGLYEMLVNTNVMLQADTLGRYLYQMTTFLASSDRGKEEVYLPKFALIWYSLTEDYEDALTALMSLLQDPLYEDEEDLKWILDYMLPYMDQSRTDEEIHLGSVIASAYTRTASRYDLHVSGQDFYYFVRDLRKKLDEDPSEFARVGEKLDQIRDQVLQKTGMAIANVAAPDALDAMEEVNSRILGGLPEKEPGKAEYNLPAGEQRQAVIIQHPSYADILFMDLYGEGFEGKYIPFINAFSDKVATPEIRLQNGAYGGNAYVGGTYSDSIEMYSYRDPNVRETYDVFLAAPDYLEEMELTPEDLEGYKISAYSDLTQPEGELGRHMNAIAMDLAGIDAEKIRETTEDVLNADISDKEDFVKFLRERMDQAVLVTVGNQQKIQKEADFFDSVTDYRQ